MPVKIQSPVVRDAGEGFGQPFPPLWSLLLLLQLLQVVEDAGPNPGAD
jgi:hypothetical protein